MEMINNKKPIKKIYSSSNIVYFVDVSSTISFELCTLFQKLAQRLIKKRNSTMTVCYIIPLNYRLTEHPENFKIKLCCFQERLSLQYNNIT